ncbi:MAG: hypothetical protein V4508_12495 [Pseudomonadota bacterium]
MIKTMGLVLALAALLAAPGCSKRDASMGPAQKAGAAIDNAGDKVAAELHDKLDKAKAASEQVAKAAQDADEKLKAATSEATAEVGKKVERAGEKMQGK